MRIEVRDNRAASRFEAQLDGSLAVAEYSIAGGIITLSHTEVPPELRGRGIASELVRAALESVRARGLEVVPRCSFVRQYIERHPEYADLLAPRDH